MVKTAVSVIIPIYNVEKYLSHCLDSVCAQTLQNIEIICVDDGSSDNSANILATYAQKDKRIKVITQPNGGYGKAVNAGLEKARGEYIAILESDDWIEPDMYEQLYNLAKEHNLDIIKADYFNSWTNGKNKICSIGKSNYNKVFYLSPTKYIDKIWGSIWSALYKTEFLQQNDIKVSETAGASYQDTGFIFKTNICAKRIYLLNKPFYHYRQDNLQSSVKDLSKVFCVDQEYAQIDAYLSKHRLEQWQNLALLRHVCGCFWNINRLTGCDRKKYITEQSKFLLQFLATIKAQKIMLPKKYLKKLKLLSHSKTLFCLSFCWRDFKKKLKEIL